MQTIIWVIMCAALGGLIWFADWFCEDELGRRLLERTTIVLLAGGLIGAIILFGPLVFAVLLGILP